jgi:hypothetical protein
VAAGVADDVLRNALIESFCIHARTLIDFFNNKQAGVSRFIDGAFVPFSNGKVAAALTTKLNAQIAHLTMERTAKGIDKIGDAERQELLDKIMPEVVAFGRSLKGRYHSAWKYDVDAVQLRRAVVASVPSSATNAIVISGTVKYGPLGLV